MALVGTTDGAPLGLAVIPQDPSALDRVADPGAVMLALVGQARSMLDQATGMEGLAHVIEWKSRGEALRVYTQQKEVGHEAELSAAEIVRRAERRIGQLIREGQEAGEIRRKGEGAGPTSDYERNGKTVHVDRLPDEKKISPDEFLPTSGQATSETYAMADGVTDEEFEAAITEAKAEGNMTRANIVRKVKRTAPTPAPTPPNPTPAPRNLPVEQRAEQIRQLAKKNMTSPQIADEIGVSPGRVREIARSAGIEIAADAVFGGQFRRIDPNRILDSIVAHATPEPLSVALIAFSELDRDRLPEWVSSFDDAIRSLQTIKRKIQKELTRDHQE